MSEAATTLENPVLAAALAGLSAEPKWLPPWLFYDERGSALFEEITRLPEYYLTRTERTIFEQIAPQLPAMFRPATVAELGAGTAAKTGVLLREFVAQAGGVLYQPIDISPSALAEAAAALRRGVPGVEVAPQAANYTTEPYTIARPTAEHRILALYIGSSIGNFAPEEAGAILRNLRERLAAGDALLLGTDLAPSDGKSVAELVAAYDDAAGVTAAFNLNMLVRLNRELGADFNPTRFAHEARWNGEASRMEMHLRALGPQVVHVGGRSFAFAGGETVHTENSYKFTESGLRELLQGAGFNVRDTWRDAAGRYAVTLAGVA